MREVITYVVTREEHFTFLVEPFDDHDELVMKIDQ